MKKISLILAGLTVATSLAGCDSLRAQAIAQVPALQPYLGGRPTPSPFVLKTGSIRGFVFGANGASQPIPLAFVTTGSISSFAGNPIEAEIKKDEAGVELAEVDDGTTVTISHDFNDGKGAVLAERRLRKKPIKISESEEPDPTARAFKEKYVYLRAGEFFLEDVPEGISTVYASFGNVTSAQNPVTVFANTTVTDVNLNLFIPIPVALENGDTPRVVEWTGLTPETGITIKVENKQEEGASEPTINVVYNPEPPDVSIELKAPPGSGGAVITGLSIVYQWVGEDKRDGEVRAQQLGPERIPIPPRVVAAAQPSAFGPPLNLIVPVGSATIQEIFKPFDNPKTQLKSTPPGLVKASIQFIDESGFAIQSKSLEALEVAVVLRSLTNN